MKVLLFGMLGLLLGGSVATLNGGCNCPSGVDRVPRFPAGTYVPSSKSSLDLGSESDYKLIVNEAQTLVIETFIRNGVTYEIQYAVTGTWG